MKIEYEDIILRDMIEKDIEDYINWFTKDIDWQDYDAPWEKSISEEKEERESWTKYYNYSKTIKDNDIRYKFEIEYNGIHIGFVSSYFIDDDYEYISYSSDKKKYRTIGIDICNKNYRGKGLGELALKAFINYYINLGINEIYTQTWSGNIRMIKLATKLGFKECSRKVNTRIVNDKDYDALTFVLK